MNIDVKARQRKAAQNDPSKTFVAKRNNMAYMRYVEIEIMNKKLLENMGKIMNNDYKSAVRSALTNREYSNLNLFNSPLIFL